MFPVPHPTKHPIMFYYGYQLTATIRIHKFNMDMIIYN